MYVLSCCCCKPLHPAKCTLLRLARLLAARVVRCSDPLVDMAALYSLKCCDACDLSLLSRHVPQRADGSYFRNSRCAYSWSCSWQL